LNAVDVDVIGVAVLKAAGLVGGKYNFVKVMGSGTINKAVTLVGIKATATAKAAIEAAGGQVKEA